MAGLPLAITARIARVTPEDIPAIWAIERTLTGPWTEGQLQTELALPHGWHWLAKTQAGQVLGYVFGSAVLDEAEIRKIAVVNHHRRQGIATQLLSASFAHLRQQGISRCFLELRATNTPALHLYQKNGFQVVGRRKSYYTAPADDAMILKKGLVPLG